MDKRKHIISMLSTLFESMLDLLEIDRNNDSIKDTPMRIAKMYYDELFSGLRKETLPKLTSFPNDYGYDQIVSLCNITAFSMCEHHFLPFPMKVHIGYIPNKKVIGLSKLARIAKYFAKRPQVQERYTKQIADLMVKELHPLGVIVVVEGRHMCMQMRGVENTSAIMVTSETRGVFRTSKEMESKFLEMIKTTR